MPLERDISIAVNCPFWVEVANPEHPFTAMLISRSRGTYLIINSGKFSSDTRHVVLGQVPGRAMPRFIYTSGSVRCLTNRNIHSDNLNQMASAPLKWRSIDRPRPRPPPSGFGRPTAIRRPVRRSARGQRTPSTTTIVGRSVTIICSLLGRENTCTFAVLYNIKRTTK